MNDQKRPKRRCAGTPPLPTSCLPRHSCIHARQDNPCQMPDIADIRQSCRISPALIAAETSHPLDYKGIFRKDAKFLRRYTAIETFIYR